MGEGPYRRANRRRALARFRAARASGERLRGHVVGANRGGVLVRVDDSIGFLPRSQMDPREARDYRRMVGGAWRGYVLDVTSRKLILTARSPRARRKAERRGRRLLARLTPGLELRGKVSFVTDYGAMVPLGRGAIEGFVPREELSWWRVGHPAEVVAEGERVRVRVMEIEEVEADSGNKGRPPRVALSLRRTQPNPWPAIAAELAPGAVVRCRVEARGNVGAWLRLTDYPRVQSYIRGQTLLEVGSTVWARVGCIAVEEGRLFLDRFVEPPRAQAARSAASPRRESRQRAGDG